MDESVGKDALGKLVESLSTLSNELDALAGEHFVEGSVEEVLAILAERTQWLLLATPDEGVEAELEATFGALEQFSSNPSTDAEEAIGLVLLGSLSPEALERAGAHLGPHLEAIAASHAAPTPDAEPGPWPVDDCGPEADTAPHGA